MFNPACLVCSEISSIRRTALIRASLCFGSSSPFDKSSKSMTSMLSAALSSRYSVLTAFTTSACLFSRRPVSALSRSTVVSTTFVTWSRMCFAARDSLRFTNHDEKPFSLKSQRLAQTFSRSRIHAQILRVEVHGQFDTGPRIRIPNQEVHQDFISVLKV